MKQPSVDNALAPLEFILSVAITLMLVFNALAIPFLVLGDGSTSFLGIGGPSVCVIAPQSSVGAITGVGINDAHVVGAKPGVSTVAHTISLCDNSPSTAQHAWSTLAVAPDFLYALGFLVIAWYLTRTARRRGLFSPHLALGVGRLGLYVLLGALFAGLLQMWADWHLVRSMDRGSDDISAALGFFHLSWAVLFAGFGLLTVGRVLAQSVRMQREIDATV